jgi:subtilisin family serine protease
VSSQKEISNGPKLNGQKPAPYLRIGLVFALAVIALWVCRSIIPPPSPKPPFRCDSTLSPQSQAIQIGYEEAYFVDNQIIVMGVESQITNVITRTEEGLSITLGNPVGNCSLGYLGQLPGASNVDFGAAHFSRGDLSWLKLQLYYLNTAGQPLSVLDVVNTINALGNGKVVADPNYSTARSVETLYCGNPNEGGGSPNEGGGSPLTGIGPAAAAELFKQQWALEHIGLVYTLHYTPVVASLGEGGKGVRVGVFDTSPPFTASVEITRVESVTARGKTIMTQTIDWVTPMLTLTVVPSSVQPVIQPLPPITDTSIFSDVSDHGLFVAGLIHEVAPNSDIRLYEVLNRHGCGYLWGLVTRMHEFISWVNSDRGQLRGAVANLSLGVVKPGGDEVITITQGTRTKTTTIMDEVESLLLAMDAAYHSGIVVVAAAGNQSWPDEYQTQPRAPQLPAGYPFVIGVAGINPNRQRSCFSNWGDVSAPAGEGGEGAVPISRGSVITETIMCAPKLQECKGDCPTAIIGPVFTWTTVYSSHYAYWAGTSFATPLVSGLAALTLEAGAIPTSTAAQTTAWIWLSPNDVAWAIKCGAATADGVINIPYTFLRCIRR